MKEKILKIIMVWLLCFTLVGCTSDQTSKKKTEGFDQFIESLPSRIYDGDDLDLNYTFNDPEKYGIERETYTLPASDAKSIKEGYKETRMLLKELEEYDYDALNEDQKLDYDILKSYLQTSLEMEDYIYFSNNYLGSFLGYQAQLPILLLEYTIHDEQDLLSYFNILKSAESCFKGYVENEKIRQDKGVGMYQIIIDKVMEQCDNFVAGDHQDLIDQMNEKIDQATFLTDEQKETYKQQNETYVNVNFVQAYRTLKEELSKIDAPDKELGLSSYKDGKKYYEALVKDTTGIDISIKELKEYLEDKMNEIQKDMIVFITKNPEAYDQIENATYSNDTNAKDVLDNLRESYTKYFPEIDELAYKIVTVPESMKDNFSPAAYLTSKVDLQDGEPLTIIINGEYDDSVFSTIVHEGYPGHMYQDNYFRLQNASTFRYLLTNVGYVEGWAQYVENHSYQFSSSTTPKALELLSYNSMYVNALLALKDIEIHYEGLTRKEFIEDLQAEFGDSLDEEALNKQYDIILETPANSLKYYVNAFYFQDYYDEAKEELKNKFDEKEFHKVILDVGPCNMEIVERQVEKYIESNQ